MEPIGNTLFTPPALETSLLLARLIGPLFAVIALGALINNKAYREMAMRFMQDAPLFYLSGALAFTLGLVIVLFHNLWVADWRVALTIYGWLELARGTVRLLAPTAAAPTAARLVDHAGFVAIGSAIILIFGIWLSYMGYVAGAA